MIRSLTALLLCCLPVCAQTVTDLKLRVEPEDRRIRPNETAVVQVQVYGKLSDGREGRLRRDGFTVTTTGGSISKPFRFQGADDATYLETRASSFGRLLGQGLGQYTMKDTFLFVAPPEPGKYTVSVALDSASAEAAIEVTTEAPSKVAEDKQNFPPETPAEDPYRKLATHWAPFIAQETWFQPRADYLARFDYDGDWRGDNNWDNLDSGSTQAYVYYAAIETSTHVYLIYNFFHPRDYSDNCALGSCHENDNEGAIVAVQKDGSEFGRLQAMETLAHNNVYSYVNDAGIRPGIHDVEGAVRFWNDSHPMVFLEAGGHGALSATDRHSLFDPSTLQFAGTGVTYVPKGVAERPASPSAREVGYELLSIEQHWWGKSAPTFDEPFEYMPFGGRPRPKNARLFGAFLGRKEATNKARPFWGWFDTRGRNAKAVNTGQWALDPAYSMFRNLTFPREQRFSLDYIYNPYLDIVTEAPRASMEAPENFVAATTVPEGGISAPVPAAAAGTGLRGALGQVLTGANRETIGGILRQAGVGAGGNDALRSLGGAEKCTLSVKTSGPAEVVLRGNAIEAPEGVEAKSSCVLPQTPVRLKTDLRAGPNLVRTLQLPTAGNKWTTRLRFEAAGEYDVVLSW